MLPPPIQVKNLRIDPPLLLAPMAGLTHSALRRLLLELGGVGLLTTEMLAARRLPHDNPTISPFLIRHPSEQPLAYQLLLVREEDAVPAVTKAEQLGADIIDLNLGCPAPEIRRLGGGSRLAEEPARVRRLVAAVRRATELPVSAKIRLGEELNQNKLLDFCRMLAGEGIDLLTVHARLRGEPFVRKPRWQWVGLVKERLTIPVVANGGIFSEADAAQCLALSGADGLMIGQAAAITPWIFQELSGHPLTPDKPALYHRFCDLLEESFAPERRLGRLKEFTHYFARNYPFGLRLASAIQSSPDLPEARRRAREFFARNEPDPGRAGF